MINARVLFTKKLVSSKICSFLCLNFSSSVVIFLSTCLKAQMRNGYSVIYDIHESSTCFIICLCFRHPYLYMWFIFISLYSWLLLWVVFLNYLTLQVRKGNPCSEMSLLCKFIVSSSILSALYTYDPEPFELVWLPLQLSKKSIQPLLSKNTKNKRLIS